MNLKHIRIKIFFLFFLRAVGGPNDVNRLIYLIRITSVGEFFFWVHRICFVFLCCNHSELHVYRLALVSPCCCVVSSDLISWHALCVATSFVCVTFFCLLLNITHLLFHFNFDVIIYLILYLQELLAFILHISFNLA